ncbi:MAG: hypothetical protein EKK64_05835 [Neisseriaceae bacterium]|nr:MAG: hypothetical protein EKK64_05835 [Neisseriaceae bacterium]
MSSQIIGLQGIESQESVMQNQKKNELSIKKEVDVLLENKEVVSRHSYFQLKYFLIGKEPTNQAKMWQCLKELKARKESLESIELEEEEIKDQIELIDIKMERLKNSLACDNSSHDHSLYLKQKEIKVKIRQAERKKKCALANLENLKEKKKWIEEECDFFVKTFKSIQGQEELRQFDDIDCQKKYWGEKLSQKLNLKLLINGQLDNDLVETIVSLPDDLDIKKQMIATLNIRHTQMTENLKNTMNKIEQSKKG